MSAGISLEKPDRREFDLRRLCETGFHFCQCCQKITELVCREGAYPKCGLCGSHRVKWCPPVPHS